MLGALLGAPSTSIATTAPTDSIPVLAPFEVRADLLPDLLGPMPLAVHHVTADDIARRPGGDLRDVLVEVAGVRVASFGSPFAASSVSLRGSTSEQVLILVDGRRIDSAQGGATNLASLPLQSIESVDVVRGGASAFWGSDAIGGAVSIRTRSAETPIARLHAATGAFGQRTVEGDVARPLSSTWTGRAGMRYLAANGDYAFDDGRDAARAVQNGDVTRAGGDLRLDGTISETYDARIDAGFLRSQRGEPGSEEFPTPTARSDDRSASFGTRLEPHPGAMRPSLDVSFSRRRHAYEDAEAPFDAIVEAHENDRWAADTDFVREIGGGAARVGLGASQDRLRSTTDGHRTRAAANARTQIAQEWRLAGRALRATGALRLDAVESFAPFVSPRVGFLYDVLPQQVRARASFGGSYRAPSFDELFWPPRASAAGNPDLRAEQGRDWDAGLDVYGLPADLRVAIDAFYRTVDDLIQWVPGASGIWRPHNVGRARLAGLESNVVARVPITEGLATRWQASGSWMSTRDETSEPNVDGNELVYRPRWSGHAGVTLEAARLGELETTWTFVDDVFVTRANTKVLAGSLRGDVRYRVAVSAHARIDLALTNLLDERTRDFRDYPIPGRSWTVGLTLEDSR